MYPKAFHRLALSLLSSLFLILAAAPALAVRDGGGTPIPPPREPLDREALRRLVEEAVPPDVKEDNGPLLSALLKPRAAPQGPSDAFDLQGAIRTFRLRRPVPAKGCFAPRVQVDCLVSDGSRGGGGAYREIHFDALGNLHYLNRLPDPTNGAPESGPAPTLPRYSLDDKLAVERLAEVMQKTFLLPAVEIPPTDAWKVEHLQLGLAEPGAGKPPEILTIAGVVLVPRMLEVQGLSRTHIPVLGSMAQGAIDDLGVFRVELDEWTRFTMPSQLGRATAPSRSELVQSISEELAQELAELPRGVSVEIAYAKAAQFSELGVPEALEDQAASDGIPDEHRYVPVLVTSVSPVAADLTEAQQGEVFSTAGVEMVTPLFEIGD